MWLRILNSMKKRYAKKRIYAIVIASAYLFIMLSLFILNRIFYSNKNESAKSIQIYPVENQENQDFDFSLSYKDKSIFDDIIRQIKITSSSLPVYTCVKVYSTNPVLYSENDYMLISSDEAEFLLPLYPASELEFNYGTDNLEQTISVEQIFYSSQEQKYYSITKTLTTGAAQ